MLSSKDFVSEIQRMVRAKHSKDHPIIGMIEDGKLDRAQGSARVAAHARHCFQNVLANLVCHFPQLLGWEPAEVGRTIDFR